MNRSERWLRFFAERELRTGVSALCNLNYLLVFVYACWGVWRTDTEREEEGGSCVLCVNLRLCRMPYAVEPVINFNSAPSTGLLFYFIQWKPMAALLE